MRKYAILKDLVVNQLVNLSDEEVADMSTRASLIDVEDMLPQPEVGWVLEGNKLIISSSSNLTPDECDARQQNTQRLFGEKLLKLAIDKLGARNLKLARENTPADVAALAGQMASIKVLLEGGALKTVRSICNAIKGNFPLHSDILQFVIDEITNFLSENGWN